jgi:hypothetical protein
MATLSSSVWVALIKIRFIGIFILLERPVTAQRLLRDLNFLRITHVLEARASGSRRTDGNEEIIYQNKAVYEAVHGPVCNLKSVNQALIHRLFELIRLGNNRF